MDTYDLIVAGKTALDFKIQMCCSSKIDSAELQEWQALSLDVANMRQ